MRARATVKSVPPPPGPPCRNTSGSGAGVGLSLLTITTASSTVRAERAVARLGQGDRPAAQGAHGGGGEGAGLLDEGPRRPPGGHGPAPGASPAPAASPWYPAPAGSPWSRASRAPPSCPAGPIMPAPGTPVAGPARRVAGEQQRRDQPRQQRPEPSSAEPFRGREDLGRNHIDLRSTGARPIDTAPPPPRKPKEAPKNPPPPRSPSRPLATENRRRVHRFSTSLPPRLRPQTSPPPSPADGGEGEHQTGRPRPCPSANAHQGRAPPHPTPPPTAAPPRPKQGEGVPIPRARQRKSQVDLAQEALALRLEAAVVGDLRRSPRGAADRPPPPAGRSRFPCVSRRSGWRAGAPRPTRRCRREGLGLA